MMLVKEGDRTCLEASAKAEPADDVIAADYHTRLPQIRLTPDYAGYPMHPETPVEVMFEGNDVTRLVECAIRHPHFNMRYAVLAAIWNHPETFRLIFQFGLSAPPAFDEIREVVAEELDKCSSAPDVPAARRGKTLLPRMPLPAHLRGRGKQ
jgi:hypothetical protein